MVFEVNKFKTVFFLLFHITAATCDFLSIVKELLQSGADCSIADNDGFRPADVADSSAIKELLNTWNQESWGCKCVWSFKSWKSMYLFMPCKELFYPFHNSGLFLQQNYYMYIRSEMAIWRSLPSERTSTWNPKKLSNLLWHSILITIFILKTSVKTDNRLKCWLFYEQPQ